MTLGMSVVLLVVLCVSIRELLSVKRGFTHPKTIRQFRYHLVSNTLEFLIPLAAVIFIYSCILTVVMLTPRFADLQCLIRFERSLEVIRSHVKPFKLSALEALLVFVVLYVLALLHVPTDARKQFTTAFRRYRDVTRRICIALALICSFTLLGTQIGKPVADLRIHIRTLRDGYAQVRQDVREALSQEVALALHKKAVASLPNGSGLPTQIGGKVDALRSDYQSARDQYGVRVGSADSILDRDASRRAAESRLKTHIVLVAESPAVSKPSVTSDPGKMTIRDLGETQSAVREYKRQVSSLVLEFMKTEDGRRLTCQVPKVLTSELKAEVFRSWTEAYPILKPIVDTFVDSVDDIVTDRIEDSIDSTIESIKKDPQSAQTIIESQAKAITDTKSIQISRSAEQRANEAIGEMQAEITAIDHAESDIKVEVQRAEDANVRRLITKLSNRSEDVRISAANKLSAMGDELSEVQVNGIVRVMRHGKQRFTTSADRAGGSHCTDYEYTSVRYYAADAVANMQSRYVSEEIRQEAESAKEESVTSERVTDPGWI